ncbi:MAG: VCBS repeat-containing protein [Planctomycetes bacterium]|nr:VCBS repeat-containing protein [Planctomycetota bacterium]
MLASPLHRSRRAPVSLAGSILLAVLAPVTAPLAQESATYFDTPLIVVDGMHRFERTLDLNNDGYADAVGWYWKDNYYGEAKVRAYLNDQTGRLVTQPWTATVFGTFDIGSASASAVADFNLDGRDDWALAIASEVRVFLSNGAAAPTVIVISDTVFQSRGLAAGDFTGDGWPDLALVQDSWPGDDELRLHVNQGAAGGFAPGASMPVGPSVDHMMTGEVDGDGVADLIVNNAGTSLMVTAVGGNLSRGTGFSHGYTTKAMPAYGDIDGDGDSDIVVFGMTNYRVLRRTGPASWSLEPAVVGGPATGLADIDRDGDLDGVCCGSGGPTEVFNTANSHFEIAINAGDGTFAPSFRIQGLGSHHLAGAVDLDHDGDTDLVAGRCVYYARGAITADPVLDLGLPSSSAVPTPSPQSAFDAESDGDIDYVAGTNVQYLNRGDGKTFASSAVISGTPAGMQYDGPGFNGDFDGDGIDDLIVAMSNGTVFQSMRMLKGNGGGGWEDVGNAGAPGINFNLGECLLCAPPKPHDPALGRVADVDNDGDLDLATNRPGWSSDSRLWLNNGSGYLTLWGAVGGHTVVDVGDFNGDGKADLLTSNSSKLGFFPAQTGASWGAWVIIGNYQVKQIDQPAVADLDGDGDLDITTAEYVSVYSSDSIVLWNNGLGAFTKEVLPQMYVSTYGTSYPHARRAWARDIDGDGQLDLVLYRALYNIWPETVPSVWILRRAPGGAGWLPPLAQLADPTLIDDVDGDGDLDLIGNKVTLATRWTAPQDGARLQYGTANAGSGGMRPTLGAKGPFRPGETPQVRLRGTLGGAPNFLLVGSGSTAQPGFPVADATLWVDLALPGWVLVKVPSAGTAGAVGGGSFTIPVNVDAGLIGGTFYHQGFAIDVGAPNLVTASNGLILTYGN